MRNIPRKDDHIVVADLLRLDHDTDLTACLNSKGFLNSVEAVGNFLKLLETFDVVFKIFASCTGSCCGNRVGSLNNEVKD